MDQVKTIWRDLGRPGAGVLLKELRRQKIRVPEPAVRRFVAGQASAQVLHAGLKSTGHIISFHPQSVYQCDLLDNSTRNPAVNQGYRFGLLVIDVYSRRVAGVLLKTKQPAEVASGFRRACLILGGFPKTLQTDDGPEYQGAFDKLLAEHGTLRIIKDQRHTNGLALVDSAIARVRRAIAQEQIESGTESWVGAFREAQAALNARPLDYLLGARPKDVEGSPVLQFALDYKSGEQQAELTSQLRSQEDKLKELGAFRVLLLRDRFAKGAKPRWCAEVHQLKEVSGGFAIGTDGTKERLRFVLPVDKDSRTVAPPAAVAGGDTGRDDLRREKLQPFIEGLLAHMGREQVHVQEAGNFLATLPGWRDALGEAAAQKPEPAADPGAVPGAADPGGLCKSPVERNGPPPRGDCEPHPSVRPPASVCTDDM